MSYVGMSQTLNEKVTAVIEKPDKNIIMMNMSLFSADSETEIDVGSPDRLDIIRNYEDAFIDYMEVEFTITPAKYVSIMENFKDLICVIKVYKSDTTLTKTDTPSKIIKSKIVFRDKLDLFKSVSKDKLFPNEGETEQERHVSARIPLKAQLIDPLEYEFRKMRCNGLHSEISIKDALKLYTNQFGISKIKIVDPDNTKVYDNFLIEPIKSIANLFEYIQERYGVYEKGLCYYVHNKTMYIYPSYEVELKNKWDTPTVHLYSVDPSTYVGVPCYHKFIDEELHIVSNSPVIDSDLRASLIEDIANTILVDFKDELLTNTDELKADKVSVELADRVRLLELSDIETMSSDTLTVRYGVSHGNTYPIMTELNRVKNIMTGVNWSMSNPFEASIEPGSQWYYHHDGEDGYKVLPATCRQLVYSITPNNQQGEAIIYTVSCAISLYTGS